MRRGEGQLRNNLGRTKAKKCWKDKVRTTDSRSTDTDPTTTTEYKKERESKQHMKMNQ
jgi:hypothetical protein